MVAGYNPIEAFTALFKGIFLGYALSPINLIPDFIPILGYLDDIIILPFLILTSVSLVPKNIILECEEEAKEIWKDVKNA